MVELLSNSQKKLVDFLIENVNGLSYSTALKLLRKKDVKVNGIRVKENVKLSVGDKVVVYFTPEKKKNFSLLYSDENVFVVNKFKGTLSEDLFESLKSENPNVKFIHRLDRNTDGVMIFALNELAEAELLNGFKKRTFKKLYVATVVGEPKFNDGIFTAYLVKDAKNSTVKITDEKVSGACLIKTGVKLVKKCGETSEVIVELFTGKTHQIRAHLSYLGIPIVGDGKYGDFAYNKSHGEKTQKLTAFSLTLKFGEESPLYYLSGKTFSI